MPRKVRGWAKRVAPTIIFCFALTAIWWWMWGECANPLNVQCFTGPSKGDHLQHFYAWQTYAQDEKIRALPPSFNNWTWPFYAPLIYGDPIPLAAALLRPLQIWVQEPFQYFSICSLINMLVSYFCGIWIGQGCLLKKNEARLLGLILATSGISLLRLRGHEALAMQCVLLVAIAMTINRVARGSAWGAILFASLGIHAYFTPMVLSLGIFTLGVNLTETKRAKRKGLKALISACWALAGISIGAVIWGYLPNTMVVTMPGELWSANLVTALDSQGMSPIVPGISIIKPYQWEGYSYIGIGGVSMILLNFTLSVQEKLSARRADRREKALEYASIFPSPMLYALLTAGLCLFAVGEPIYLSTRIIAMQNPLYEATGGLAYIFRATGRFVWPGIYSLLIWAYCSAMRKTRGKNTHKLAIAAACLLIFECNLGVANKINQTLARRQNLDSTAWQQKIPNKLRDHITNSEYFINVTGEPMTKTVDLPRFAIQAINPLIKTNYSPYLARIPEKLDSHYRQGECKLMRETQRLASEEKGTQPAILFLRKKKNISSCGIPGLKNVFRTSDGLWLAKIK